LLNQHNVSDSRQLELFRSHTTVNIYVSDSENSAVHTAVHNLIRDIEWTCGCKVVLSKDIKSCAVVIGTATNQELADVLEARSIPVEKLKKEDGAYRWEAFLQQAADGVLHIIGTDRRGVIYGIYDLCTQLGVSPWYYWADVPVKQKTSFQLPADYSKADWPSVMYRGIFINDEEELDDWAKLHTPDGTIGPTAYRHLFELLLRLKANYIWPAMHVNYFNGDPQNAKLAEEMGVVVGTSHCDMLLRSNQNEWEPWIKSKGYTDAIYDYSIEGRNREILKEYWRESVETNKNYEVCFTMGMRGIHDSGFHTQAIDEDPSLNAEQKIQARVDLLGQVIKDQRQILREVLGGKKAAEVLQNFVPYKEVLSLYDRNLDIPDDVTLIWANDNFGHIRRYPNESERKRSGGHGLYYHASYWASPGSAMSYLFINSTPLAHTGNELRKAYESGIRKLWIVNVGGLKPIEQDMEYFLHCGWEAGKENGLAGNAARFTEDWINSNFSGRHGVEAAEIYEAFAQATNVRKIEHMRNHVFSQTVLGDEAGRRLMLLEDLYRRGNAILESLPEEERTAFFQLFLMKIHASYYTNHEYYYADRSTLAYERGNMQAADKYVELSVRMLDAKRRMLQFYNKKMSGGKWDLMLTPESFSPPPTAMYPARKPALGISESALRVDLWNGEEALRFSPYGLRQKWLELGNQGEGAIPFSIAINEGRDWISLSEASGTLQAEQRILISVHDPLKHAGKQGLISIHDLRNGAVIPVKVQVEEPLELPENFQGYIEADGYVSMPAAAYHRKVTHDQCGWVTVPGIGRYEGAAMMAWNAELRPLAHEVHKNPCLEYEIYLKENGSFLLEIHRFLTLDSTGRIRFGVGVDDSAPILVESETRDEWKGSWQDSIFNNGEKLLVPLPYLHAGIHRLKLYMVDNYVTVSKLVLYTGPKQATNLGPVTSRSNQTALKEHGLESPDVEWSKVEQLCQAFYKTSEAEVIPPNVLYAPKSFYTTRHEVFRKCLQIQQPKLGPRRYEDLWKSTGTKDVMQAFGSGAFVEQNGIVAIEAEYALANSEYAYLTPSHDGRNLTWTHLQAETNGRTGFAMHVAEPAILWENAAEAPAMHYKMLIHTPGAYGVWMLLRHYNKHSDSCYLALDGVVQPVSEQACKGNLHTYNTSEVYYWCFISDMDITAGEHVLSVLARKSELRIDRIYLTQGDELPPVDAEWMDSERKS
jgi:hypothetical protein